MIYRKHGVELGEKNCHVTGFFPAPVTFSWTKSQENVTEGTCKNVPFLNKDRTFNQFSTLEFTPKLGDIYSSRVEHLALDHPLVKFYAEPYVRLHSETPPGGGPLSMLVCSV
ncbi:HLA class II histocompatibility antigen, DP alpha 1 chain-like [Gasterosteus aculeatus]